MSIHRHIEGYKLHTGELEAWTPYWVNEPGVPDGPFRGKGAPEQIQGELDRIISEYADTLHNAEEVRYLMLRNALGIDCSGFVYHVLSRYIFETESADLAWQLVVDKSEIEQASYKEDWQEKMTPEEVAQLPDTVSLRELCDRREEDPAQLTNVRRLCDERASIYLKRAAQIQPADMIHMITAYGDHIGIVTEAGEATIRYASSDFDPLGPGGITFHELNITDANIPVESQQERGQIIGAYRLRILTDQ